MKLTASTIEKCIPEGSWFKSYMKVWPLAEPPKSYILLAAMSMMGACIGRRAFAWADYRAIYPMLNLLLIGPSGIGKSSAIEMARLAFEHVPLIDRPQFFNGSPTPEKLHDDLLVNPHAVLFASELANFFNKQDYNANLIPYVTELLDYRSVEKRTKGGGIIKVDEPAVTVIGGSTVEWLQEQLPNSAVSGGFLARFLICQEDNKQQKVADPDSAMSDKEREKLQNERARVFVDFARIVGNASGKVVFDGYGSLDLYTIWYSTHNPISGHLAPFAARAPEFIKRFAILFAISRGSETISESDVAGSLALYEYCEKKLQGVVVPMSPKGKLLGQILSAIGDQPKTYEQVYQAMRNFITAQECQTLLQSLTLSKDLLLDDGKFSRKWN